MESALFAGVFTLPWWGNVFAALLLTHVTIISVTVFLHRHQTHHALDLHPAASHFFRLWLWLTTGMVTKEWVAVHRKHHAKVETPEDPHSPQVLGLNRVLWTGALLYAKATHDAHTIERYGQGTPDDWLERNLYSKFQVLGITLMGSADIFLFGVVPGTLILLTQIAWIPFWAAGVINGIGHYWGYRHWATPDASTNIAPWGIIIGGEELHNNHHAYPTSARLSIKWYEFDIGWLYIRMLSGLRLAKIRHVAPVPRFAPPRPVVGPETLQAVVANRYDVLAKYARSLKRIHFEEVVKLQGTSPVDAEALHSLGPCLDRDEKMLGEPERAKLAELLPKSGALATMVSMRRDLVALWGRSAATRDQLVRQLQDWCHRAEASGIGPLAEFSRRLRSYA